MWDEIASDSSQVPSFPWCDTEKGGYESREAKRDPKPATVFLSPIACVSLRLVLSIITFSRAHKSSLCVCPFLSTLNNTVVLGFLLGRLTKTKSS